jgi:SAM-dependent methyltransferase
MPSPETLSALYARYSYDDEGSLESVPPFTSGLARQLVDSFSPYRRSNRLLDVGFGAGVFLKGATDLGWEAHGVEYSEAAVELGRKRGLPNIQLGDFLTVPLLEGFFDVVIMSEIVEHIPDPFPFVRRAYAALRPGGLLYLTTPNGRGLSGRMLGVTWSVWYPPIHIHLFSDASARKLVQDGGFRDLEVTSAGLNPYEIIDWVAGREQLPAERVTSGYQLNESLTRTPLRRTVKATANRLLALSGLGDGLKIRAHKP